MTYPTTTIMILFCPTYNTEQGHANISTKKSILLLVLFMFLRNYKLNDYRRAGFTPRENKTCSVNYYDEYNNIDGAAIAKHCCYSFFLKFNTPK